ncbi:nuclear protein localization protein 4, partial [Ascosphaera acerosa]
MASERPIILRFESRNGQFRLTVPPSHTFGDLQELVLPQLPAGSDGSSIVLSNKPIGTGGDERLMSTLVDFTVAA